MNKKYVESIARYADLLLWGGISLFVLGMILFAIKPTIDNILETKTRIEEEEKQLALLTQKDDILKKVNKTSLEKQSTELSEAIPYVINLPQIVATLQEAATQTDIKLGEFTISSANSAVTITPLEGGDKITAFEFQTNLDGNFENTEKFLNELSNMRPLIRVASINFSQNSAKAVFRFYFQPKLKAAPKPEKEIASFTVKETKIIDTVSGLALPVLQQGNTNEGNTGKVNPFR
jgi:hypothetical protein